MIYLIDKSLTERGAFCLKNSFVHCIKHRFQFVMKARGRHRLAGRRLEVGMDTASLNCFFSLITFGRKGIADFVFW